MTRAIGKGRGEESKTRRLPSKDGRSEAKAGVVKENETCGSENRRGKSDGGEGRGAGRRRRKRGKVCRGGDRGDGGRPTDDARMT